MQGGSSLGKKIIMVMLVIAVVLLYFVYRQVANDTAPTMPTEDTAPSAGGVPGPVTGTFNFPPVSADERAVLDMAANKEDQTNAAAYMQKVAQAAKEGGELALGAKCALSPVVLKVKMGGEILIKNYDTVPHAFATLDGTLSFSVPANESIIAPVNAANFGATAGAHAYSCDNAGPAGIIWVSE